MSKEHIKARFSGLYSIGRAVRDAAKNSKKLKETTKLYNVAHDDSVEVGSPLAKIYVNEGPKRLNIVFKRFDAKALENNLLAEFLAISTEIAKKEECELRIISRNNLANPKDYTDFLKKHGLTAPNKCSFYTDSNKRVSGKTYRLSVTKNDVFFTEQELDKLKDWIKNGK